MREVPRNQWPRKIKLIAEMAAAEDVGVGDTVHRLAGGAGEAFKAMFKKLTGQDCGCSGRRERWNVLYSYAATEGR